MVPVGLPPRCGAALRRQVWNIGSSGDAVEWFEQMDVVRDGEDAGPRIGLRGLMRPVLRNSSSSSITSPGPCHLQVLSEYRRQRPGRRSPDSRAVDRRRRCTFPVLTLRSRAETRLWLPRPEPASKQTFHL